MVNVTVAPNTQNKAFSLVEILITISIITCICFIIPSPKFKIENLANDLRYAKQYALKNSTTVFIKPLHNWNQGYQIYTIQTIIKTIKHNPKGNLSLHMFSGHKNILQINHDGTTHNNGHFAYNNIRLYWNKRLRLYLEQK